MTGTDILSTLNTPSMNLPTAGTNYKPLHSKAPDDENADFTMVMTAKISTSVQEISAKQAGSTVSVTASSRTVRAEVFSISAKGQGASFSSQNNIKNTSSANASNAAGADSPVTLSKDDVGRVSKALDDFKTGINDVLKKELGVTDEDIEAAMEDLGLSYLDLTDTNKLAQLMMQLLGNDFDAASLLSLQNFSDIKNSINDLAQDLFQTTGLSMQQLTAIDGMLTEAKENGIDISDLTPADGSEEINLNLSDTDETAGKQAADVNTAQTHTAASDITPAASDNAGTAATADPAAAASSDEMTEILSDTADTQAAEETAAAETDDAAALTEDTVSAEETVELTAPAAEEKTTDTTDNLADLSDDSFTATKNMGADNTVKASASQNTQNQGAQTGANENHQNALNMNQQPQTPVAEMRAETPEVPVSYTTQQNIDTRDILNQMATGIRTAITERATTMELQLNPENLGKMSIRVTSEEGQVNAHVTLENENVRTAMETQMGILKQNLEAQGIKVNEVTVTADAHQFERNLEEGQAADMAGAEGGNSGTFRNEEEGRRGNGRIGNIDMRSLDQEGLSNLSEDERLAAQIMKEQGNTISINA